MNEKYFIKNIISIFGFLVIICPMVYIITGFSKPNQDIYEALKASKEKSNYSTVLIGDSVSRQIFNVYNQKNDKKYWHLNSNQAIGVIGNYILLNNYLKENKNVKEIYYIMRPNSFNNDLNQKWTYTYFVLPFYKDENIKYFSKNAINKLERNKFYLNSILLNILEKNPKLSLILKIDYSNEKFFDDEAYLSEISIEYLNKIKILCKENNIKFKILSCPLNIIDKNKSYDRLKQDIYKYNFTEEFEIYFNSIMYFNDNYFSDGVHFKENFLEENRKQIIKNLLLEEKSME